MERVCQNSCVYADTVFTDLSVFVFFAATIYLFMVEQRLAYTLERFHTVSTREGKFCRSVSRLLTGGTFTYLLRFKGASRVVVAVVVLLDYHGLMGGDKFFGWLATGSVLGVSGAATFGLVVAQAELNLLMGDSK